MVPYKSVVSFLRVALLCFCLSAFFTSQVGADDQQRAREAVKRGDILSFQKISERLSVSHPGKIIEIEFDDDDGTFQYEVKIITSDNRIVKLDIDARSGMILKEKIKNAHSGRRR